MYVFLLFVSLLQTFAAAKYMNVEIGNEAVQFHF
jgi:hypothetical protein